jgi:hypothetical protein
VSSNFGFEIKRCVNKPTCKSKHEIDMWKKDAEIYVITLSEKFNQKIYGKKPTYMLLNNQK